MSRPQHFTKWQIAAVAALALLVLPGCSCGQKTTTTNSTDNGNQAADATAENTNATADPAGTIVVEAGDGTLSGVENSSMDYIAESARGLEAYLGSKGATATYTVDSPRHGTYQLSVKLSDDGVWENGYRDATVTVNGVEVMTYQHVSEDTKGWKWYTVGNLSMREGDNTIAFTKKTDMPAAYVMDEFKLVPVNQ